MVSVNDKRNLLRNKRRQVDKKVSRLRSKGVEVAGTEFDPRGNSESINNMSHKQLNAALKRHDAFLNRGTQFVGDMQRRPIPANEWKQFNGYQKRYNANIANAYEKVRNVKLPSSDPDPRNRQTVDDRMKVRSGAFAGMTSDGNDTPYRPKQRQPGDMVSRERMKELMKLVKKQADPSYLDKRDRANRARVNNKLRGLGTREGRDLMKRIRKLNSNQFRILFAFSDFGEDFSIFSGTMNNLREVGYLDDVNQQGYDNAMDGMKTYVKWAEGLKV